MRSAGALLALLPNLLPAGFVVPVAHGFLAVTAVNPAASVHPTGMAGRGGGRWAVRFPFLAASSSATVAPSSGGTDAISATSTPPSWDELASSLPENDEQQSPAPLVTLYRDTNGWCPFCERVWLILRAKGIPYAEQLISLQNKPEWYKALVPTTLVPAVLFHGDAAPQQVDDGKGEGDEESSDGSSKKNERRIVWESMDIMCALDDAFPTTPRMIYDTPEFDAAVSMNDDLNAAGFAYVYAGRNDTLTDADRDERRTKFLDELDRLDLALQEGDGPFRLGKKFSGLDAIMVPTLERWRYQLPLTSGIDILANRPGIVRWFEAMDAYEPYAGRVAGDEYSWTATNSMFLRYFGGGEDRPDVADAIRRADEAAERLAGAFAEGFDEEGGEDSGAAHAVEAARKLIVNHDAVVADCTRSDPASQQHIPRTDDAEAADDVLRYVASILLSSSGRSVMRTAGEAPLLELSEDGTKAASAAIAARTVASRLCVPRDMSAPAARVLRGVLSTVADRLVVEESIP